MKPTARRGEAAGEARASVSDEPLIEASASALLSTVSSLLLYWPSTNRGDWPDFEPLQVGRIFLEAMDVIREIGGVVSPASHAEPSVSERRPSYPGIVA